VGYFSYDAVRYLEKLPDAPPDELRVPEAYFAVTDTLIVFDHLRHKVLVISLVDAANLRDIEGEGFTAAYRRAADDIRRVAERLAAPTLHRSLPAGDGAGLEVSSNFTRAGYEEAVERAKEYIRAGGRVPDRAFATLLCRDRGPRLVPPLPGVEDGKPLSVHDVPEARGSGARWGLAGAAGAGRGPPRDDPARSRDEEAWRIAGGGFSACRGAFGGRQGAGRARNARGPGRNDLGRVARSGR
jgi:hypothetical protein